MTRWRVPLLLLLLAVPPGAADFKLSAGNWTHSTSLFSEYHFVPGYNEKGEWDIITGGNCAPLVAPLTLPGMLPIAHTRLCVFASGTATNHTDANLIGDAQIYLCPCPEPPCDEDPEPPTPGYSTSVFGCVDQEVNVSHAVCTVYHAERSNVTCVTPTHAVSCDVPGYDDATNLVKWWENDELPSRSYFSPNVTAVSCIIRDLGERPLPHELGNFSNAQTLQEALSVERCEVRCLRVCRTVCKTEHLDVHALIPELNDWRYDSTIDNNPREFVANGSLWQERSPAQYLRGASSDTLGQERIPLNITCTLPTLTDDKFERLFGNPAPNLTAQQGLFDLFGRRINGGNVFDLALYVSLHALLPLTGRRCVTPFPPASSLDPLPGEATAYADTLVCHEPTLTPYNFSLGPVGQAGDGSSTGGRRLDQDEVVAFDGAAEEGSDEPSGVAQRAKAEAAADIATWSDGIEAWDDWVEWGEGNGSHWDWQHAAKVSAHRDENHWNKRWRKSARSPPRRRLLYHEFEIERSPWDFWLQESKVEREARLRRQHAEKTGDCRFYHNCTDPLPPPLLLHMFECWKPNSTVQPNVSTLPPRSLSTRPKLHATNDDTANGNYSVVQVHCIQPSWPNSTGISCLTPSTAITCPYTDAYRGNLSALVESGADTSEYLNETTVRCTTWPLVEAYRRVADAGLLFTVPKNLTLHSYLNPWERPCDRYVHLAVGYHHYCAIDEQRALRCSGHDAYGRSSLDWTTLGDHPAMAGGSDEAAADPIEVTKAARKAAAAAADESLRLSERPEDAAKRRAAALALHPPAQILDVCAGEHHTCAVEETYHIPSGNYTGTMLRCWGSNYSNAIDVAATMARMAFNNERGGPRRVVCGKRFVCALQPEDGPDTTGPGSAELASKNWRAFCTGRAEDRNGVEELLPNALWQTESVPFTDFEAGAVFACGSRNYKIVCFGNAPPTPIAVSTGSNIIGIALGGRHACVAIQGDTSICYSGSGVLGPIGADWLSELVTYTGPKVPGPDANGDPSDLPENMIWPGRRKWSNIASISIADSVACIVDFHGQASCAGERAQVELSLIRPPVKLQPLRTDLVERGVSLYNVRCGGFAARNGTLVQLGEQFCCGIGHDHVVHCWGKPPPHYGVRMPREDINAQGTRAVLVPLGTLVPLEESNLTVFHVHNRRCVSRARYLRDFGLQLLLDTHANVSLADATTNLSSLYNCFDVPRRLTFNMSEHANTWLGANLSNTSAHWLVRSWHATMLLSLSMASYADDISCFNFTQPFPSLHCAALLRFVNRTVEVVKAPPKPFTIERLTANDVMATKYTLAHTVQPDHYCFEKLRLTPSEQFKRGGAWYRATQRVVDGFEAIFSFQMDNSARLCKTVRALVTSTLLYERCMHTGSDGLAFLLRGGGPPAALGGGGALLGYGGLNSTLAIEIDTWHNADHGDMYYDHISVQTGGPNAAIGAHKEHYLSAAAIDPEAYPAGLADGKAHLMRVVYTPGFDADLIPVTAPPASVNHIKYWVEEGPIRTTAYPHSQGTGSWKREGTGMLRVYLDNMDTPMLALPIDLGHTLGLDDGRAWVGLTASTGRRFQNHYVLGWQFCEGRTGCRQPMTSCEAFGCNPLFPSARYNNPESETLGHAYAELSSGVRTPPKRADILDATHPNGGGGGGSDSGYSSAYDGGRGGVYVGVGDGEPSDVEWGAEPDGWQEQLVRPRQEAVLADFPDPSFIAETQETARSAALSSASGVHDTRSTASDSRGGSVPTPSDFRSVLQARGATSEG